MVRKAGLTVGQPKLVQIGNGATSLLGTQLCACNITNRSKALLLLVSKPCNLNAIPNLPLYSLPILYNLCDERPPSPYNAVLPPMCIDLEITIKLKACDEPDFDPNCPPLIFTKPIKFCCDCPTP